MSVLFILLSTVLVNNFVLVQFLGLCPFIGTSKKLESAVGLACSTSFVLVLTSMLCFILYNYLLVPFNLIFLKTLVFIVTIAFTVQMVEILIKKTSPMLHQILGIFLPLITTNCIVLGVVILNTQNPDLTFIQSITTSFGAGLGFSLSLLLLTAIRDKLQFLDTPKPFSGVPIALITASILSLAFMGFAGFDR